MRHYIELSLLPDLEVDLNFLWAKVYPQIHLALVEIQDAKEKSPVGVAFPEYSFSSHYLGKKLRLFATNITQLEKLNLQKHLSRLTDYVQISPILAVPADISQHVCFSRVQVKTNVERLARRKAMRENISQEQALALLKAFKAKDLKEPFIHMQSLSRSQEFRLFIRKQEMLRAITGKFGLYGLSKTATVPWF